MATLKKILTNSYVIIAVLASFFVLLFSTTTSPLYIDHHCWFLGDAGIFQEMGLLILQGGIPYIDLFDHKGPILFFIQALGLWINKDWGLYILQVLSLTMTMIIWFKMAVALVDRKRFGLIIIAITLCFLLFSYQRGDLCEEWSLLFISLPIYFCLREIVSATTISRKEFIFIGICVGIVSFIRINNVAPLIPFVVFVLGIRFFEKKYIDFGLAVWNMAIGFLSVAIACCLVFYLYAGWMGVYEMLYGTFIFNFSYITNSSSEFTQYVTICFYIPIVFFLLITVPFTEKKFRILSIIILSAYIISLLSIGRSCYAHYCMIFLPLYLLTLCLVLERKWKIGALLVAAVFAFSLSCDYSAIDVLVARLKNNVDSYETSDFHRFVKSIPEEERNSIYNEYAFPVHYFVDEQLVQCNRLVLPGHIQDSKKLYEDECDRGICVLEPQWVLLPQRASFIDQNASDYLATNYYLADSIGSISSGCVNCYKMKKMY